MSTLVQGELGLCETPNMRALIPTEDIPVQYNETKSATERHNCPCSAGILLALLICAVCDAVLADSYVTNSFSFRL